MFTADRGGAVSTFLCKQVAEAVEAVGEVIPRGEPLASQLLLAANADEALLVPGLVAVVHSTSGDGLKIKGGKKDTTKMFDRQRSILIFAQLTVSISRQIDQLVSYMVGNQFLHQM